MYKKLVSTCIAIMLSHTAFALDPTHPSVNPGNVINTQNQTLPGAEGPSEGEFQTTTNPQYIKNAEQVTSKVLLKDVQLLDAKVIPHNVKKIYRAMIGQQVGFKDIQQLAAQLQQAYRADGYILVQVILPPQTIDVSSGIVQLQVINGRIKNIIFIGENPKRARRQLHRYAEQIEVEDPVSYHSIDRFLALANQLPGIDVSATIVPDKFTLDAADLIVSVRQTTATAFVNVNNRGTKYLGPYQSSLGSSLYDLFGADSLTLVGSSALNSIKEMQYGSIDYDLVFGKYGTSINPSANIVKTQPGNSLAPLEMKGSSNKYNLSINQPLYFSTQQKFTFQTALYHSSSTNRTYGTTMLYDDQITAFNVGFNYQGLFWGTYHDITLSMTRGEPILGSPKTLTLPSVANAKTTFTHYNLLTSDIHYFTQRFSAALGGQFQYSPNILVSSEQIGYGGQQFGQAFTPYIISGNSGAMGSIALRYDLPLFWKFTQLQPEIFYDGGAVFYTSVAGHNSATAQSAGAGLNFQFSKHVNGSAVAAKPTGITQTPGTSLGWAGFFNLTISV